MPDTEYYGIQQNGELKNKMNRSIIITSIFPPTKAVNAFSELRNYRTIVVGDNRSPAEYSNSNVSFLSVKKQAQLGYALHVKLPYNHYSRKNLGYIYAIREGAEIIIDTDDDNIPYPNWSFPEFSGEFDKVNSNMGFINIYNLFTDQNIWPRGLPLNRVRLRLNGSEMRSAQCNVGIWQALADADPDVDAIYRLLYDHPCFFKKRQPVVLGHGTISPFNSQNTAFGKELFPLLYLPSTVSFRFTDILRGLVAQPIMWLYNYSLGITEATVLQERNPHDYMKDFKSEIPCYIHGEEVIELISGVISTSYSIYDNLKIAYEILVKNGIVEKAEINLVERWIKDLQKNV
jgi:hypothetical protein